jgi:ubiquinone/menaquinone biosynthesis C-methylase UbiE
MPKISDRIDLQSSAPHGSPGSTEESNQSFYDEYYNKPAWWFRLRYDTQVKKKTVLWLLRVAGISRRDQRVLEIGFGSGVVLFSFDQSCEISGVEVSRSAVARARARAKHLGFTNVDFREVHNDTLPFADGAFDIVIASHVLEHVADDIRLLSEVHRVLNDGGVAIILVPINERYVDPKHLRTYDQAQLVEKLTTTGLQPRLSLQNETLFYLVERFYFEGFRERWGVWGTLTAGLVNVPAALLPFPVLRGIDFALSLLGFLPRQCAIAAVRIPPRLIQDKAGG